MRRTSLHIILPLVALLWLLASASCSDHSAMRQLEAVEAILDDAPADARARLDSIDASALQGESRALYAMLKTQADYKCYVDISSDSLIREATTYYGTRRKSWRAAMSWYSLGCVHTLQNDDIGAIDAYLKAQSLFPDTLTRYYALTEFNIGQHYDICSMYDEALSAFNASLSNSVRLKDSSTVSYCKYYIATLHLYKGEVATIGREFHSLISDTYLSDLLRAECLLNISKISLYFENETDTAINYVRRYLNSSLNNSVTSEYAAYGILGDAYSNLGNYDSAFYYYDKSVGGNTDIYTLCDSYRHLYELAASKSDTAIATTYSRLYTAAQDSILRIRSSSEVASVIITANRDKADRELREQRKGFMLFSILALLSVITVALTVFALYYRRERDRREYYIRMMDETRHKQLPVLSSNASAGETLSHCQSRFQLTPSYSLLCGNETASSINKSEKSAVIHDITVSFAELNALFQTQDSNVNIREFYYCVLVYIGCENKTIEWITGLSVSTQRTVKCRLKDKMSAEMFELLFGENARK